jgi:hypothetical protein
MSPPANIATASAAASADPSAGAGGRVPFFGWRAVAAAFVVAVFGWGLGFYGPPVYLEVVRQSREWSIALISGAVTLHFAVGLGLIPNLPRLYRRFGLASLTVIAGVIMVAGVVGWATALARRGRSARRGPASCQGRELESPDCVRGSALPFAFSSGSAYLSTDSDR